MKSGSEVDEKGKEGEDFVNELAYKSFLRYWCYPNPIDVLGDKKEICDLLVIFNSIAIIISVKNYTFDSENPQRYEKRAIEKSISQLKGAERKLFNLPGDVVLKHAFRDEAVFDKNRINKLYRIAVHLGEITDSYPLPLADVGKQNEFYSVFDKETFQVLLKELDTISDFSKYLDEREKLLFHMKLLYLGGGEKDLLSYFLRNKRAFPDVFFEHEYHFSILDFPGEWNKFNSLDEVQERNVLNKSSYAIDNLVETQVLKIPDTSIREFIAEEFMSLNRVERRTVADSLLEFIPNAIGKPEKIHRRVLSIDTSTTRFVFVYYPKSMPNELVEPLIETVIRGTAIIQDYAMDKIVAIAGTNGFNRPIFGALKVEKMSAELEFSVMENAKLFKLFSNEKRTEGTVREFPNQPKSKKLGKLNKRNPKLK